MLARSQRWVLGAVAMAAVGAFFVFAVSPKDAPPSGTAIGGPFALTTQDGRAVSDRDFRGKWLMIYFGYTHCPNICPMTLGEIASTLDRLGPLAERVQPLFITIDPARDTGEVMDAYVKAFDSRIIGLTGTAAEIAAAAKGYRVYYAKKAVAGAGANDYEMEHSAYVYVMDPNGRYVTLFSPAGGQGAEQMEARLRELITPPKQ